MKKIIIVLILLFVAGSVWANDVIDTAANTGAAVVQKEKTIIVYDVYRHMETSSNVFLGIGGLSIGMGIILLTNSNGDAIVFGSGFQSVLWGAAETGLYLLDKNFGEKVKDPNTAREKYAEMCGWNAVFDLALIVGGGCMAILGNNSIKGHGIGIMMQGAMLATFNSINFFIASNPDDIKDWGAGVKYNIQLSNK